MSSDRKFKRVLGLCLVLVGVALVALGDASLSGMVLAVVGVAIAIGLHPIEIAGGGVRWRSPPPLCFERQQKG